MEPVWKKNEYLLEVGENIRKARINKGLSQDDLADITDSNRKAVSRHENGSNEMGLLTFLQYAEGMDVDPAELLPKLPGKSGTQVESSPELYNELAQITRNLSERDLESLLAAARVMAR